MLYRSQKNISIIIIRRYVSTEFGFCFVIAYDNYVTD